MKLFKTIKLWMVLGLALILIVVVSVMAADTRPAPLLAPWPAFTMVYQEYRYPNGYPENAELTPPTSYNTWQLEYVNLQNWKLTLIESTYQPESIGEWSSYDGKVYRSYSPLLNSIDEIANDEGVVPSDWLSPGMREQLLQNNYVLVEQTSGQTRYVLTVPDFVCSEGPPICPGGKTTFTYVSEFVFNNAGIPLEVIDKLDNIISRHIIVRDLVIQ